ncbi:hypothetical protein [Pseudomonas reinekei]
MDRCKARSNDVGETTVVVEGGERRVVLDLGYEMPRCDSDDAEKTLIRVGRVGSCLDRAKSRSTPSVYGLKSVLRQLVQYGAFHKSMFEVEVEDRGVFKSDAFFVKLVEVCSQHAYSFGGYWGVISGVREAQDNGFWINVGGRGSASVLVEGELREEFFERNNLNSLSDLSGRSVMVLGSPFPGRKLFIPLEGVRYCAIC